MTSTTVLILLYIQCIGPLFAEDEYSNYSYYSFILDTAYEAASNSTTKTSDLPFLTGDSFITTLCKTFNTDRDDFALFSDIDITNNSYDNHTLFVTVALDSKTASTFSINLLFEAYVSIQDWRFEEYIYYDFLRRSISFELKNSNTNIDITLQNLTWVGRYHPQCQSNTTDPHNWKDVTQSLFKDIQHFLTWIFIGMLGLSCFVTIVGYIHSWIVWNEDIVIGNSIFYCFATFDWYSDILFTFSIPVEFIWLWLISFCLLLIPLIGNVAWLVSQQRLWEQDAAIGPRIKSWLVQWRPFLYSITIISGSAFGSITICNSNMLGYPLFRMGLRNIHLEKFDSKRLFITVLGENVPQLVLQGFYWFFVNENFFSDRFSENKATLTLAMISGIISILYAFGTICSQKATLAWFNDNEEELFEFNVISSTDWPTKNKRKNRAYKYKIWPLRKAFASLLQVDITYVELHPPIPIEYGYQLRFTLMVKNMGGNQAALQTLRDLIEYREIAEKIQDVWELDTLPRIEELKWKKDRKRDYQENMVLLQHNAAQVKPNERIAKKPQNNNDASMSQNSFSYAQMAKKSYFQAPDPSVLKLPEVLSDYPSNPSMKEAGIHSITVQSPKHVWVPMASFSQSNSAMRNGQVPPSMYRTKSAEVSLYRIVSGAKGLGDINEEKMISIDNGNQAPNIIKQGSNSQSYRREQQPPPPPHLAQPVNVEGNHNAVYKGQLGPKPRELSIGSVNSEAAFQQQLFNHIRSKNTVSTKDPDLHKKV